MQFFLKKRGGGILLKVFLVCLVIQGIFFVNAVNSSLGILNSAPFLNQSIPNQSWASNMNLTNAFRLNDYFLDDNGDTLTFNYSNITNIAIFINESTSEVSFYPDTNFIGNRTVTFYASDPYSTEASNLVYLQVGQDTEAPKWFNATTSSTVISQNDLINFSTRWTDNIQLKGFIFSINQGSGWVNYTSNSLTGIEDYSSYRVQISAAPSSTVYWKIYAWDGSYNFNVTDVQSFTLTSSNVPSAPSSGDSDGGGDSSSTDSEGSTSGVFESILQNLGIKLPKAEEFVLEQESFEVELLQGLDKSLFFKIKNTGSSDLTFNLEVSNLEELVFFDEKNFSLSSGSEKGVLMSIKIPDNYLPGQYYSYLVIYAGNLQKVVPLVITVKPFNPRVSLNLTIPQSSKLVSPGKNITFDLNFLQKEYVKDYNVTLYVAVKDYKGNIYSSLEENLLISESNHLKKSLLIPKDAQEGEYLVYGQIEYLNEVSLDSDSFEVGYRFNLAAVFKWGGTFLMISILAIIFILLAMKYEVNKRKEKLLSLYLLLSKLKESLAKDDLAAAAEMYIKIKSNYGEGVPKDLINDKEFLKRELKRLSNSLNNNYVGSNVPQEKEAPSPEKTSEKFPKSKDPKKTLPKEEKDEKK